MRNHGMKSIGAAVAVALCALAGCDRISHADRTTSIPSDANKTAVLRGVDREPSGLSAPPAPAERGPAPANAIDVAPGTDASAAFANDKGAGAPSTLPSNDVALAVRAEEAAARAPDTAAADAAKKAVLAEGDRGSVATGSTARDTAANAPRNGTLTPREESTDMPKAGQANNHSSTALDADSGKRTQ